LSIVAHGEYGENGEDDDIGRYSILVGEVKCPGMDIKGADESRSRRSLKRVTFVFM
jgi:hypothetical protein